MKKTIINVFIILFLVSIYKDLTLGTEITKNINKEEKPVERLDQQAFEVIKVKIKTGDTVLTVMEKINPSLSDLNIEQVIEDFSMLNPNIDPNSLQSNRFYFFPKYD
jgi:hypothetical protein